MNYEYSFVKAKKNKDNELKARVAKDTIKIAVIALVVLLGLWIMLAVIYLLG